MFLKRASRRVRTALLVPVMMFTLALPTGCEFDLGDFSTTTTTTLDGREVVSFLVRSAILTPVETAVNRGVDWLFNRIEGDEDDE